MLARIIAGEGDLEIIGQLEAQVAVDGPKTLIVERTWVDARIRLDPGNRSASWIRHPLRKILDVSVVILPGDRQVSSNLIGKRHIDIGFRVERVALSIG